MEDCVTYESLKKRLLYYLVDILVIIFPIILFINSSLLVFGNILPFYVLEVVMNMMIPILCIFIFGIQILFICIKGGTSGSLITHLVLCDEHHHKVNKTLQYRREWFEKSIPFVLFYFLWGLLGITLYAIFLIAFICFHPEHNSWVDVYLHTHLCEQCVYDEETTIRINI